MAADLTTRRGCRTSIWSAGCALAAIAGLCIAAAPACAAEEEARILILNGTDPYLPAQLAIDSAMRAALAKESARRIVLFSEPLDAQRFAMEALEREFLALLTKKYSALRIDVVVAVTRPAFDFFNRHGSELWPGARLVFHSVPREGIELAEIPPNAFRVSARRDLGGTLDIARRLQPNARRILVVSGVSELDLQLERQARVALSTKGEPANVEFLSGLPLPQLLARVAAEPADTIVFYLAQFRDRDGRPYTPRDVMRAISSASAAPVYGLFETYVGFGVAAGSMEDYEETGRLVGEQVRAALAGGPPAPGRAVLEVPSRCVADARALQRWSLDERRLPDGCEIRFADRPYWRQYLWQIVAVLAVIIGQGLLIAALLAQRRRRRLAEASLRESEQRMTLAVDAANFGIWVRDLARNEIWASDKWRELFGFARAERLELQHIQRRLHPDDRNVLQQILEKALAAGGSYETEFRLLLPDGGLRWIASQGRVEFDAKGQPALIRGASRDITASKESEQESMLLRQEIAHVGRVSMMGQLAAALAHEINQPLGAILRNAEAAELFMQNASPDLDEVRAILADIRKDDQRAGNVIDRMRGLLKRHNLDAQPLDLDELIGEVAALVRVDAVARKVTLEMEVSGDLPSVRGDRVHLQQVLLNLILNGMDAVDGVGRENRRVNVDAQFDGAQTVQITVSDTGAGIPADKLAQVFDPFFTTKPTGLGMGLSISRTIIEAHGGKLWAANSDSGGARFRFTLPIAAQAAAQ